MKELIYTSIVIISLVLFLYIAAYINWRKDKILIATRYFGESCEAEKQSSLFYFSVNDQNTIPGKIFVPAIMIDLKVSNLTLVEE